VLLGFVTESHAVSYYYYYLRQTVYITVGTVTSLSRWLCVSRPTIQRITTEVLSTSIRIA